MRLTSTYGTVVVPDSGTAEYPSVECDVDAADIKGEQASVVIPRIIVSL